MRIYDISMPVFEGMPVYKNKAENRPVIKTKQTGEVTETIITLNCHNGTHLDAPLHVLPGTATADCYGLQQLIGLCRVLDFSRVNEAITRNDLVGKGVGPGQFLLFKTKNSLEEAFNFNFIYLAKDGSQYLADLTVAGVGIDALGIERDQPGHPSHKLLLQRRIPILEGLRLREVEEGEYLLIATPLFLVGTEAAPVRAVLVEGLSPSYGRREQFVEWSRLIGPAEDPLNAENPF